MKVLNIKLANKESHFSIGAVKFDENGIGELPDELAKDVLNLPDFFPVPEEEKKEETKPASKKPAKKDAE